MDTDRITTTFCLNGRKYSGQFQHRKSVLRFVVEGKTGEPLVGYVTWGKDAPCILRCLVQAPDGAVLYDQVSDRSLNHLVYHLGCQRDGPHSVYLTLLATGGPSLNLEFCAGESLGPVLRRVPVLFVVDRSQSMSNEEMDQVEDGMKIVLSELRSDPCSLETAALSCLSFDSTPLIHGPLTDLISYELPRLNRHPVNEGDIGAALRALDLFCATNIRRSSACQTGDRSPVVLIFTNGNCPAGWDQVAKPNCIVILTGKGPNQEKARRLSDLVVRFEDLVPLPTDEFRRMLFDQLFWWVDSSIKTPSGTF